MADVESEMKEFVGRGQKAQAAVDELAGPPGRFVPARHRNGGEPDPSATVEAGLNAHLAVVNERDRLRVELGQTKERVRLLELQIEQIEETKNTIESRIKSCILERDHAVSVAGELRGIIRAIGGVLEAAAVPAEE